MTKDQDLMKRLNAGGCFWWLGDMQGSSKVFIAEGIWSLMRK